MFRGNPTRTWYGTGPAPTDPVELWRYPDSAMCGRSSLARTGGVWCGTGWTGQPVVWDRPDGITEIIFGAYDKQVHFVDAATGTDTRPSFPVGDIIKGSVSLDPDGYPLLYFGARDDKLRVVALDRDPPTELWARDAHENRVIWNDDWDGNPAIVDDIMFAGGENGWLFAFRLNRGYDGDGLVQVTPEALVEFPGFTDELLATVGPEQSIENSVALYEGRLYFANGAGRVVGLDIEQVDDGEAPVVFDWWGGEDIDASLVVDDDGMLYVAAEQERFNARGLEVGQLVKLDPGRPDDPIVWSVAVPPRGGGDGGMWATPALGDGALYVSTHPGELLAVDTATGEVAWRDEIGHHAWSSPVIVDGTLILAVSCDAGGGLRSYDLADPLQPVMVWDMPFGAGCIESTPAVWNGRIYVGSRNGYFYAFGDEE
jgi:outer membrane protein assembly factor BamB